MQAALLFVGLLKQVQNNLKVLTVGAGAAVSMQPCLLGP